MLNIFLLIFCLININRLIAFAIRLKHKITIQYNTFLHRLNFLANTQF